MAERDPAKSGGLITPQFILGGVVSLMVWAVSAAVIWRGDAAQINLVLGAVFGFGGMVFGHYFGSSNANTPKEPAPAPPPVVVADEPK